MSDVLKDTRYVKLLNEIKEKIRSAQIKAAIAVNRELLGLYWEIGKAISKRQRSGSWGDSVIDVLSKDLSKEFPRVKGFSRTNLFYIRQWYLFYAGSDRKVQQLVGQLTWGIISLLGNTGKIEIKPAFGRGYRERTVKKEGTVGTTQKIPDAILLGPTHSPLPVVAPSFFFEPFASRLKQSVMSDKCPKCVRYIR